MNKIKTIYWFPRILAIFYLLFLSLFALDVFDKQSSFTEILIALLIHLIPNFIFLIILIIAWKKEKLGGILFLLLGLIFTVFFKTYENILTFTLISLPIFVISASFIASKRIKKLIEKSKINTVRIF